MDEETQVENESQVIIDPQNKKSSALPLIGVVVALLAVIGVVVVKNMKPSAPISETTTSEASTMEPIAANVKEFTVDGSRFEFDPATITVSTGDTVKIIFKDSDGKHNLVIDDYKVQTETIEEGGESSVTFLADKPGTYEYYCAVDGHREEGMVGSFIVQ